MLEMIGKSKHSHMSKESYSSFENHSSNDDGGEVLNEELGNLSWLEQGAVTAVRDQGFCGASYAFASAASVEGAYQIKHGELKSFSV